MGSKKTKSRHQASRAANTKKREARRKLVSTPAETRSGDNWSPATSAPGEIYTPMGGARAAGAFARGLKNFVRSRNARPPLIGLVVQLALVAGVLYLGYGIFILLRP